MGRAESRFDAWVLRGMFFLLLLFFIAVTFGAYVRQSQCARHCEAIIGQVRTSVRDATPKVMAEKLKACTAELSAKARETQDSNTISFLFTVFSIVLFTGGVYILVECRKTLDRQKVYQARLQSTVRAKFRATERVVRTTETVVEEMRAECAATISNAAMLCSELCTAYQMSTPFLGMYGSTVRPNGVESDSGLPFVLCPRIRNSFTSLGETLREMADRGERLQPAVHNAFFNMAGDIVMNLSSLEGVDGGRELIDDAKEVCRLIDDLLDDTEN